MKNWVDAWSNVRKPHLSEMGNSHPGNTLNPPENRSGISPGDAAARNPPVNLKERL